MAVIRGGQVAEGVDYRALFNAGTPSDGTSGTGAGHAQPGSLCVDTANGKVYVNKNTKASPTWVELVRQDGAVANGASVANTADANAIGGLPVLHRLDIADAATGDVDLVLTHKTRVCDAWLVKTAGNGAAGNSYQVKNGANAISDAISGNVNDQATVRAASIDDAQHEIAAGGTLRVTRTRAGGNAACIVYVLGLRVA